jgi:hypothetical protein
VENAKNVSSEEELLQLRNEGKITDAEYKELLSSMRKIPVESAIKREEISDSSREVPWQIWVVVAVLGFEGIGNLLSIPQEPRALIWLGAKCIFILGLLKGWKWVFGLSLIVGGIHVLYFMLQAPLVALMNLVLIALILWSFSFYFPQKVSAMKTRPAEPEDALPETERSRSKRKLGKIAFSLMLGGIILPIICIGMCILINRLLPNFYRLVFADSYTDLNIKLFLIDYQIAISACIALWAVTEAVAFVLGVIAWSNTFGKVAVASIAFMLVLLLLFHPF